MTPNGYRFIGIAPEVDLTERRSKLINDQTEPFTLDEIRGYKVFTALLTQSGGDAPTQVGSGNIIEGVRYSFVEYEVEGWDFTNVGGPKYPAAFSFTATVTAAPILWGGVTLEYNAGAPVVNVLENTIGNIWFTYSSEGSYLITSDALFTENKTILFASSINNGNDVNNHTATVYTSAPNELTFASWGNTGDNQMELDNYIPLPIEIRVYN